MIEYWCLRVNNTVKKLFMIKLMSIAGARPNFMELVSIVEAFEKNNQQCENKTLKDCELIQHIVVHTGQYYDKIISFLFFQDLNLPKPDIQLEVGLGSLKPS